MKFGLLLGRMQPFHKGHQEIINEILLDGRIPIIVLGSSEEDRDLTKNPLTYAQRKELIRLVYPNVPMIFVRSEDHTSWDTWFYHLTISIRTTLQHEFDYYGKLRDEVVFYYHNKEVDRTSFYFKGKNYSDTFYTDIFTQSGFMVSKEIEFPDREDIQISANARDIRANLEQMKHLLDARVYNKLKEWL